MKILNFINLKNYNGTSSFFIDITKEFLLNNVEVIAITNEKATYLIKKLEELRNNNLKIITISNNKFKAIFQYIFIFIRSIFYTNKIAFVHDTQRFPLLFSKIFHVKNYLSIFGEGEKKIHKFHRFIDNICVTKKYQLKVVKEQYPNKNIFYFPYTVVIDDKNFIIPENKNNLFTFGCLGVFYKLKGFNELILACDILKNKGYKFQLLLGGYNEEENNLKKLVKDKNLEDYCIFLGKITNKEEFYRKLNVFCFTSYKEDIGFVVPEAISYGIPVIANRIGFVSDALTEDDYLAVEADNLKNIEEKWSRSKYTKVWWETDTNYRFETEPLNPDILAEKMEFAINNYDTMKEKAISAYNKLKKEYNLRDNVKSFLNSIK